MKDWKKVCNLLRNFLCLHLPEEKTTTGALMSWCHNNWWGTVEVWKTFGLLWISIRKFTQRADTTDSLIYSDWWFEGEIIETCPKHTDLHCQTKKSRKKKSSPLNRSSTSACLPCQMEHFPFSSVFSSRILLVQSCQVFVEARQKLVEVIRQIPHSSQ